MELTQPQVEAIIRLMLLAKYEDKTLSLVGMLQADGMGEGEAGLLKELGELLV